MPDIVLMMGSIAFLATTVVYLGLRDEPLFCIYKEKMLYFNLLLSIFPIWGSLFLFTPKDFKEIHTKVFTQERTDYAIVEGHIFNLNSKYGKDFEDGEELIFTQLDTDKKYCGVFITAITHYKLKEK